MLVLVEYLHEDEGIEHHCLDMSTIPHWEDGFAIKVQDESYSQLIYGLSNDHLPHCQGD